MFGRGDRWRGGSQECWIEKNGSWSELEPNFGGRVHYGEERLERDMF